MKSTLCFVFCCLIYLLVCSAETLSNGDDVGTFVQRMIDENEVVVFAKSYCPFCKKTRSLLVELQRYIDVEVEFIDLDRLPEDDGPMIQAKLLEITGQRTVPNVFIAREHVGGNSDLEQLNAVGKLEDLLIEASGSTEL